MTRSEAHLLLPAFKNAAAVRLAARCSQNERTMLGALEVVAVSARLANGERRKERLLLLGALLEFHGELFGFGAMEEAKCFVDSLAQGESLAEARAWIAIS